MCEADLLIESDESHRLQDLVRQVCYRTARTLHRVRTNFSAAAQSHVTAYRDLTESMRDFMNQWETLGEDFYS